MAWRRAFLGWIYTIQCDTRRYCTTSHLGRGQDLSMQLLVWVRNGPRAPQKRRFRKNAGAPPPPPHSRSNSTHSRSESNHSRSSSTHFRSSSTHCRSSFHPFSISILSILDRVLPIADRISTHSRSAFYPFPIEFYPLSIEFPPIVDQHSFHSMVVDRM